MQNIVSFRSHLFIFDAQILRAIGQTPIKVLILNVHYYSNDETWETRCTLLNLYPDRDIDICKYLKIIFPQFDIITIHASKREFYICDAEDFSCAVAQRVLYQPRNYAMDIWINLNE